MERFPANPDELRAEIEHDRAAVREEFEEQLRMQHEHPAHSLAGFRVDDQVAGPPEAARVASLPHSVDSEESEQAELQAALANLPVWNRQFTLRGLFVGVILGGVFCIVTHKLSLTLGIIPSLNVASGLLAFVFLRAMITMMTRFGHGTRELTQQEVNVVQTFITAASAVAFTGGFGTYLIAMDSTSYEQSGESPANRPQDVYNPNLGRVIPYLLCISMIGAFMLCALRKTIIIDYNLTYPSGTATGHMIQALFTKTGAQAAAQQIKQLVRFFFVSFFWDAIKWLFSGSNCDFCNLEGVVCQGIEGLPLLGMKANTWTWYLSLTPNTIGAGMICPPIVNISMMLGSILTWGWLWPYITSKAGEWYPAGLSSTNFAGVYGYKVFITIALMLGDGAWHLAKVLLMSLVAFVRLQREARARRQAALLANNAANWDGPAALTKSATAAKAHQELAATFSNHHNDDGAALDRASDNGARRAPTATTTTVVLSSAACGEQHQHVAGAGGLTKRVVSKLGAGGKAEQQALDDAADGKSVDERDLQAQAEALAREEAWERRVRNYIFLSETIPWWISLSGYLALLALGTIVIPFCYPPAKWYYVIIGYIIAPFLAVPIAFGCGLTDWDVSSTMGKLSIFIFAAWAGVEAGGVITGLVLCGVVFAACSAGSTLMQDFRTGWIVKSAPRAMFVAQVAGGAAGALLAPITFLMFWSSGEIGNPEGPYPAPYALIYRGMAIFGTQGFSILPQYCPHMMLAFFLGAMGINLLRDLLPEKYAKWVPIPIAMAIPFVLGAYIAIDMCIGSLIVAIWAWRSPKTVHLAATGVAAGLIVGDGLWSVPMSILGSAGVMPPLCTAFTTAPQSTS